MKSGKYVYKDEAAMKKMHEFYNKTLASLDVPYEEEYFDTTFGKTHCIIAGDSSKPMICTIHGGNGITTLNLKLFKPLLSRYCILTPDVIGMPGKSEPYRNISSGRDEYGKWIREVLEHYGIMKIPFVVSSYSASMFMSFAKDYPEMVDKALLLVPSGIAHGPYLPMLFKLIVPFTKYYFRPSRKILASVMEILGGEDDEAWSEFFDLMMGLYKMELKGPKEYGPKDLAMFTSPLLIAASPTDIFFPADRVFKKADEIFIGHVTKLEINCKHLPDEDTMAEVCRKTLEFFEDND